MKSSLRWSQCQKYYYDNSAIQFYNNSVCLRLHICCLDLLPTAITLSVSRPSESVSATDAAEHTVPRAKNATGNETMWTQVTCTQKKHNIIYSSRCLLYDWCVLALKYGHFHSDLSISWHFCMKVHRLVFQKNGHPICFCYNFVSRHQIFVSFGSLVATEICNLTLLTDLKKFPAHYVRSRTNLGIAK